MQCNIVIQATSGLVRLDPCRHDLDSFSMDSGEVGWYLSQVTLMLVSFSSFILSGVVFGMVVLISVDIVKRGSTSSSVLSFHICCFACHGIIIFHDIASLWHVTSLSFFHFFLLHLCHSFIHVDQLVCHEYDKYVP